MNETPNKERPQADVDFIIEELLSLFNNPETDDHGNEFAILRSQVGSTFHARVMNAAAHLGVVD